MQVRQRVKYWAHTIQWYFNYKWHRDGDLPTSYYFDNEKLDIVYYRRQDGYFHRTTGPAVIDYEHKTKSYYYQGKYYSSLEEIHMLEACR